MLVIMDNHATQEDCERVEKAIESMGFQPVPVPGAGRTAICVTGNKDRVSAPSLERLDGVLSVVQITKPYKLVSREVTESDTMVTVGDAMNYLKEHVKD